MDIGEYLSKTINMYFGKVEEGYKYVKNNVGLWDSIIVYYVIILISMILSSITDMTTYETFGTNTAILIVTLIITSLIFLPIGIFVGYGLIHLFLKLFGGKATFKETIKFAISASIFSGIIGTISSVVTNLLISNTTDLYATIAFSIVMMIISIGIGIWAIVIMTKTLSLAHQITAGKTFLAIIMPILIILVLAFIIGLFLAMLIGFQAF